MHLSTHTGGCQATMVFLFGATQETECASGFWFFFGEGLTQHWSNSSILSYNNPFSKDRVISDLVRFSHDSHYTLIIVP